MLRWLDELAGGIGDALSPLRQPLPERPPFAYEIDVERRTVRTVPIAHPAGDNQEGINYDALADDMLRRFPNITRRLAE